MPADRIAILWRDADTASELRELIATVRPFHQFQNVDVTDARSLPAFLSALDSAAPYAIFLEVSSFTDIAAVLDPLLAFSQRLPLIAYGRTIDNGAFLELHRGGMRQFLHLPASPAVVEAVLRALTTPPAHPPPPEYPTGRVVSFLPAKPGVGASTAAAHFAHVSAGLLGRRVAIVDLDLTCGVQGLMPQVVARLSLPELMRRVHRTGRPPEENQLTRIENVDIFHSGRRSRSVRIENAELEEFLNCLCGSYPLVVVDHSGNWERYSVMALRRSAFIFYISTSDFLSLSLALSGKELLEEESLDKVRFLLNRGNAKGAPKEADAEKRIGLPLYGCLPNSYSDIQGALKAGAVVSGSGAYNRAIRTLATRALEDLSLLDASATRSRSRGIFSALGLDSGPSASRRA